MKLYRREEMKIIVNSVIFAKILYTTYMYYYTIILLFFFFLLNFFLHAVEICTTLCSLLFVVFLVAFIIIK